MTEPVKRGPGRPRVAKMQRTPRVYKLNESGNATRIAVSLTSDQAAKVKRVADAKGLRPPDWVRLLIDEAPETIEKEA